jgi:hypothetical protein
MENKIYQKIGILGSALIQVTLRIMLKIDQPPIALAHTLYNKEWKKTTLNSNSNRATYKEFFRCLGTNLCNVRWFFFLNS